jgi:hypothetical protein
VWIYLVGRYFGEGEREREADGREGEKEIVCVEFVASNL